jgi:hypothetical protein
VVSVTVFQDLDNILMRSFGWDTVRCPQLPLARRSADVQPFYRMSSRCNRPRPQTIGEITNRPTMNRIDSFASIPRCFGRILLQTTRFHPAPCPQTLNRLFPCGETPSVIP